ncbi:MAG: CoA transferase, partial [Hymenobacter sp.]
LNAASPHDPPQKLPVAFVDLFAAHQLKEGILTALYQREKTGRGTLVEVSLYDSALASLANQGATWLTTGHDPVPLGSGHPGIVPYGTVYRAADGQRVVLAVGTDAQFRTLCEVLQRPHWAAEPRFANNQARVRHRAALEELLLVRIAELNGWALLHELARLGVPAGAVRTVGEALHMEQARPMLLPPPAPEFPYPGLRTVAFRSPGWPVAEALSVPPPLPDFQG